LTEPVLNTFSTGLRERGVDRRADFAWEADDGWSQESVALVVARHFCLPKPREWRPLPGFPREASPSLVSFYASH
jgi:hypothetical protein